MLITRAGSIEVSQYFLSFLTDYDSSSKKANTNRNVIREKTFVVELSVSFCFYILWTLSVFKSISTVLTLYVYLRIWKKSSLYFI